MRNIFVLCRAPFILLIYIGAGIGAGHAETAKSACPTIDANLRDRLIADMMSSEIPRRDRAMITMIDCGDPALSERAINFGLASSDKTLKQVGLRASFKSPANIVMNFEVPEQPEARDTSFLKQVGTSVSFVSKDFDWKTGRGTAKASYNGAGANISVSGDSLTITSDGTAGALSCFGSFKLTLNGELRGKASCISGNPFPQYNASIIFH